MAQRLPQLTLTHPLPSQVAPARLSDRHLPPGARGPLPAQTQPWAPSLQLPRAHFLHAELGGAIWPRSCGGRASAPPGSGSTPRFSGRRRAHRCHPRAEQVFPCPGARRDLGASRWEPEAPRGPPARPQPVHSQTRFAIHLGRSRAAVRTPGTTWALPGPAPSPPARQPGTGQTSLLSVPRPGGIGTWLGATEPAPLCTPRPRSSSGRSGPSAPCSRLSRGAPDTPPPRESRSETHRGAGNSRGLAQTLPWAPAQQAGHWPRVGRGCGAGARSGYSHEQRRPRRRGDARRPPWGRVPSRWAPAWTGSGVFGQLPIAGCPLGLLLCPREARPPRMGNGPPQDCPQLADKEPHSVTYQPRDHGRATPPSRAFLPQKTGLFLPTHSPPRGGQRLKRWRGAGGTAGRITETLGPAHQAVCTAQDPRPPGGLRWAYGIHEAGEALYSLFILLRGTLPCRALSLRGRASPPPTLLQSGVLLEFGRWGWGVTPLLPNQTDHLEEWVGLPRVLGSQVPGSDSDSERIY